MTASESLREFFGALEDGAWARAASFIEPTCAAAYQTAQVASFLAGAEFVERRREPGSQATGYASDGIIVPERLRRYGSTRVRGHPAGVTIAELAGLSPEVFLARQFQVSCSRPALMKEPSEPPAHLVILGEVPWGTEAVYVVYFFDGSARRDFDGARDSVDPIQGAPWVEAVPAFHRGERWLFGLNVALRMEGPDGFDELVNTVPEAGSS